VTTAPGGGATAFASDAWYPSPGEYWVTPPADEERPFRYGDLFAAPAQSATGHHLATPSGQPWHGVMVLSPSCEIISKAKDDTAVEVARVVPLTAQDAKNAAAIVVGWQEKEGRVTVAFASTVFLAGVPHTPTHAEGMFADLKQTTRVTMADLRAAGRIAALDYDARVAVIRREIYYRYRWLVPMQQVRDNEAVRIKNDPFFTEPRPPWGEPE